MNDIIRSRKSIRKYDPEPLDAATIEKVLGQIETLRPLYEDIRYTVEIVDKAKGLLNVKAPHYLIFRSEEKDGSYENIGFIGQQMDLFFSGSGLGSCWLGAAKPEKKPESALPHVIGMAFGRPDEPLHRDVSDFKRKSKAEISEGDDERIEAARLAPSAVNAQNWYFIAENGLIHCYRKKSGSLLGFIYDKLHCIDLGIALCHIARESAGFSFAKVPNPPLRDKCFYMGTVSGGAT